MALAPSIVINLPGYPFENFPSLENVALLRMIASAGLTAQDNYVIDGTTTSGDGGGGVYAWNPASLADDDGLSVIKPDDKTAGQAGRWIQIGGSVKSLENSLASSAAGQGASKVSFESGKTLQDLATTDSSEGAGLIGFSQAASYDGGTGGRKMQQRISPLDHPYLATGDASVDDLSAVNSAIAAAQSIGEVDLSGATYRVSAKPTNPAGVIPTNGSIVMGVGAGAYQLNSYSQKFDFVHGRGNDYALKAAINAAGGGSTFNAFFYGDSTVATSANGGIPGDPYTPDVLLAQHIRTHGGARAIGTFTNRAVGGANWSNANPVPDLGTNTKLMVFKYAVNHVSGQDVLAEINAMRTVLANVRAQANGAWDKLTIVLVGPNSTHDTAGGRTSYWYERLRNAYVQAAWDYGCVYIDLYGLFPDSTRWAGFYADTPAVHAQTLLTQQMWAYVGNALLPSGGLQVSTGARWVSPTMQNSWTGYDNGFQTMRLSLNEDGKIYVVGGATPPGGTITAGQVFATAPNVNYRSARSAMLTGWTFNGSAWATMPCGVDSAGDFITRASASGITALIFQHQSYRNW